MTAEELEKFVTRHEMQCLELKVNHEVSIVEA